MPPFILHHPKSVNEACQIAADLIDQNQEFDWVSGLQCSSQLQVENKYET